MSIRAMNWAMEQATGCPWTQCLLYVIADVASPEGICWPSADWMASKSQQSRATVYRRLGELRDMGLLAMFPRFIDDEGKIFTEAKPGRRQTSPEIRLILSASVDLPRKRRRLQDEDGEAETDTESSDPPSLVATGVSAPSDSPIAAVRQGPSHCSDSKRIQNLNQEIPPNPPAGGERVIDEELEKDIEEFRGVYPAPITDMPRFRSVMTALTATERIKIVTAAKGYAKYIADLEKKGRGRNVKNAHTWISNGMWQGYVSTGEKAVAAALIEQAPVESETGKAWATIHKIAHVHPLESAGRYYIPRPLTDQAKALAQAPPLDDWVFVPAEQFNQCGAWKELIREALAEKARPELAWDRNPGGRKGFMAPWPWPPRKDGSICTGPPSPSLATEEDLQELSNSMGTKC